MFVYLYCLKVYNTEELLLRDPQVSWGQLVTPCRSVSTSSVTRSLTQGLGYLCHFLCIGSLLFGFAFAFHLYKEFPCKYTFVRSHPPCFYELA